MPRETVAAKALRYLSEQRLTIERADPNGLVVATCRGETGRYTLGWDPVKREFRCGCLARGRCCHIEALRKVVER